MSTAYGILQLLSLLHSCLCSVNVQYITVRKITSEAFSTMYIYFAEKIIYFAEKIIYFAEKIIYYL